MKRLAGVLLLAGALFGAAWWLDLTTFTDLSTGLCRVGSVWLRYGALALLAVLGVLGARPVARRPAALARPYRAAGVAALAGAAVFAVGAVLQFLLWPRAVTLLQLALELVCAAWLALLGRGWLACTWSRQPGGAALAAAGSVLFYWLVLVRFMQNSSSYYRVLPTAAVLPPLAALMFLSALARALLLPDASDAHAVCRSGLWAFYYCLCMELPQSAALWRAGASNGAQLWLSLGMCCVGALGAVCAVGCLAGTAGQERASE